MSDEFDPYEDERVVALERAICAAENGVQVVACLWETLTAIEQDRWLAYVATTLPRRDVALKTLLPTADQMLAEMRAAGS